MSATLAIAARIDWRASVEQASASDWITVAAYLGAAIIAAGATRTAGLRREPRERAFWMLTAVLMTFLGINELLDLQKLITLVGKEWAMSGGWYEERRTYQLEFIVALAAGAVLAGLAVVWLTRAAHRAVQTALLGLIFIGVFVLLRAASFHHVDALLGMGPEAFNWGSFQEMAGILIVGLAALAYSRGRPRSRPRRAKRR